jgi:hypothetical protein
MLVTHRQGRYLMHSAVNKPGTMDRIFRPFLFRMLYCFLIILVLAMAVPASGAYITINPVDPIHISINATIVNATAGDTIILNPGIYNEHDIKVSKDIVIQANTSNGGTAANTIINGQMQDGIFNVTGIYSLAIDNLSLQNGSTPYGGAINLHNGGGTLTVNYSVFKNCSATIGGAIYSGSGSLLTVTSSTFSNCSATGSGGAIRLDPDSSSTITGSTFSNCSATGDGGAILFVGPLNSIITGSGFSNCSATGRGGAIGIGSGTLTVTSSTFSRCSAGGSGGGGAIFAGDSSTLTINSSTFSRCSATGAASGGAIYTQSATADITSCTFFNCTSPGPAAIMSFQSNTTVNFSRIYGMPSMAVSNNSGTMNARDNWWGSNSNPSAHVQYATYSPWLILNITATPASISQSQTSTIRVNLTRNTTIRDTTSGGIFVPDGIPVAFARSSGTGSIAPQAGNLSRGANMTTFTPAGAGTSTITATVDDQTVSTDITVTSSTTASRIGVFRNGAWFLDYSGNGWWDGPVTDLKYPAFGTAGDVPVAGNWSGDGISEIGVFRNGAWYLDYNGNGWWDGPVTDLKYPAFGTAGDVPVAGNWSGDGISEIGVFRNGAWYLDYNGNGWWDGPVTDLKYPAFGSTGDAPVAGDWNNDGISEIGVFRNGAWYLDYNGNGWWDGPVTDLKYTAFGTSGDKPVTGIW